VVRSKAKNGHTISMDVTSQKARLEDILSLATKGDKPFMTGVLNLKTKMLIPPGQVKVLEKLKLDGEFNVSNGQWASADVREKLEGFSRHAEGEPSNQEAGSSVSDMKGHFRVDEGVITFHDLEFSVPGAAIDLAGNYNMRSETLDFSGHLNMKAKVSQMTTGAKSLFLKAIDPLFAKNGSGTVLPITISGTRQSPTIGVSVFHKTIKKSIGQNKNPN
jgi:hypothetical protein